MGQVESITVNTERDLLKVFNSVINTGRRAIIKVGNFVVKHPCFTIGAVGGIMAGGGTYRLTACSVSAAVIITSLTGTVVGTVSYLVFDKILEAHQKETEALKTELVAVKRQLSRMEEDNKELKKQLSRIEEDNKDLKAMVQGILDSVHGVQGSKSGRAIRPFFFW